jgi:predicted glycosyltransferase
MKVLIDINHPAHVHFFKNLIRILKDKGHEVIVTASLKEINYDLLRRLNIDFIDLGSYGSSPLTKMLNVPLMALKMRKVVSKHKPDILMGIASSRICHGTLFSKKRKTWVFTDTEHAKEQILLFKPFADIIFTPDCFLNDLGKTQVRYPSYHELAYLHPNNFTPNTKVLDTLKVKADETFFLIRFVSWEASHDIGQKGLSFNQKMKLLNILESKGKVFISDEGKIPSQFEKYKLPTDVDDIHHVIYFATMYIGEGGTMASEAAVLGTPSVFISSLKLGYLNELEDVYSLMYSFKNFEDAKVKIEQMLNNPSLKLDWKHKRKNLLEHKVDITQWMIDYFENHIEIKNTI